MIKNMLLPLIKARPLKFFALIAVVFAGVHSGSALALACTPGLSFNTTSGFTLGCASPALWSILSINQNLTSGASAPYLQFGNGGINGIQGAAGNVGAYGGVKVTADANATFTGNIFVQNSTPATFLQNSTPATDTSLVDMTSPHPTIVVNNDLLTQARVDALQAASLASALTANQTITTAITNAKTIDATKSGLNVVNITNGINLSGLSDILTFNVNASLYSNVEFVVNITGGNFNMASGATVVMTGGSTADPFTFSDLLFNVRGAQSQNVTLGGGSQVAGIILDVGGDVYMDDSTVTGEVIGGHNLDFRNTSTVVNNTALTSNVIDGCTADANGISTCVIRTAVPEPGTIALLVLGLLGIFGARMRRSRSGRPLSTVVPA
jgi:PEP-CTERM motif